MQQIRVAIAASIVFFILGPTLLAQNSSQLGDESSQIGDENVNFYTDTVETVLAPESPFSQRIRQELTDLDPKVGIEIGIPIPVHSSVFEGSRIDPPQMMVLYNILRKVSTMEGIEYYSASRGEMRTFYHESYAIAGPEDNTRIADPTVTSIPRRDTIYVFQRDGSFGENIQRIDFEYNGKEILMSIVNLTTMVYKVVPLVSPENLRTFVVIQPRPDDNTIAFYGNLGVRVPGLFGMRNRARDSFYNRIVALHGWFADQLSVEGLAR